MPISRNEFFEFEDDNWKNRVYDFLLDQKETETPAYGAIEIARKLSSTFDSKLPDTKRKVEWALVDLMIEGKVIRTRIKLNDSYYYMLD
jgi:hypothetical protein